MSFVQVENLWISYGNVLAVKGISFTVPKGEIFGLIGSNGAGKTSTLKVLATVIKPKSGRVHIDGIDILNRPQKIRGKIGYVPDVFGVYDDLTAREYLHFFAAVYRIERTRRQTLVDDVLKLTDLTARADSAVESLSLGMKQRLALARVLLHDPELLILDEPASGLDPRARIELRELLKELHRMGKTIIISSHILHELSQLCTCFGILDEGKLAAEGSLEEVLRDLEIQRAVHVQIANLAPELLEKIRKLEGVERVDELADRLSIRIQEKILPLEDLLDGLRALGARLRLFQPEILDMEKVFLKITEGKTG
ncbi:MAG: ABC transporter ATP-binding protein [Planctomycetes bacterium]|nr:ABC transporter ATP-binding protein [Planctomycetota bacterium]